ncbi:MAG: hypothetical protein AAF363_18645 [Bacteroidota bacterium]
MISFNSEEGYKDYFEKLQQEHVDLSAFVFGDGGDVDGEQRSGPSDGYKLWLNYYSPIRFAGQRDNYVGTISAEFSVMYAAAERDSTRAELQSFYQAAEAIVQQIFARIEKDYNEGVIDYSNEPQLSTLRFGRMERTRFGSSSYEGCLAQIDFHVALDMAYDESKWSS